MSTVNLKNNVLHYFLISTLQPMIKIFELINTNERDTYAEAQEILGHYAKSSNRKHISFERIKIESRKNSFHIFIPNDEFIYISYSNSKFFSSEQNFALFDEIHNYLCPNEKTRTIRTQSFLIEDEKEEIKDIVYKYIGEACSTRNMDLLSVSAHTENEKEILQVNSNDDINNNISEEQNYEKVNLNKNSNKAINIKKILKNYSHSSPNEITEKVLNDKCPKKNESSGEDILNNKNINNNSLPYMKSNKTINTTLKNDQKISKNKLSTRTLVSNNSKINNYNDYNDIKEKPISNIKNKYGHTINKNYSYNKYNYDTINFKKNKPDSCSKSMIIGILISVIILQIAAIPLIINFYDFSV
jgi:hypothetical protein